MDKPAEFVCTACGMPESALPAGHNAFVTEDLFGWPIMVCTTAVQRNEYVTRTVSIPLPSGGVITGDLSQG